VTTRSAVGKANRAKGARAELAVVHWLRANGWPGAERAIATGHRSPVRDRPDLGDITGTPGLVWQVTDRADIHTLAVFERRMAETEQQRVDAHADYGVLVERRRGMSDPGQWWAHMPGVQFPWLFSEECTLPMLVGPVRFTLADLVMVLRDLGGFGEPLESEMEES
jgi:hypothetical protein